MAKQRAPYRKEPDEYRDDAHMDRVLANARRLLASSGLDPDNLPWRWVDIRKPAPYPDHGYLLVGNRRVAQAPKPDPPYFERWRHRVDDGINAHTTREERP